MKILHITESNGFSGGVNQMLYLARILKEKGVENIIACPENAIVRKKAGNEFRFLNFNPFKSLDIKTIFNLKRMIENENFDIIHCHHSKAHHYSFIAKKLSTHKPILVVSRRVSHPIPENLFAKVRYKSKDINAYIAVSMSVKKILMDYGIEENKISVIYSGVDRKRFHKKPEDTSFKRSLEIEDDTIVISHIGNFSNEKGQIFSIKAAKILYEKGYRFKIIFAGMRTDSNEIKDLFLKNNLPLNYGVFLGLRDDIENILNITDISINASIKGEALSGSIRESLACGVSVVASDISGNSEIVKDGENGFLFKPGDYHELSTKIEILINNKQLREKFSENAIKTIDERFTVEKMATDTFSLYLKLLAN